ncbi:hypothetical protein [Halobacteriovorax marinus]|nr:hypothetical protein [Halobacteriovorax marinus]
MSLKERMRLEEIESESLLRKPQWHVKEEENEAEIVKINHLEDELLQETKVARAK